MKAAVVHNIHSETMVGTAIGRRPIKASPALPKQDPVNDSPRGRNIRRIENRGRNDGRDQPSFAKSYLLKGISVLALAVVALTSSGPSMYQGSPRRLLKAEDNLLDRQEQQREYDISKDPIIQVAPEIVHSYPGHESTTKIATFTAAAATTTKAGKVKLRRNVRGKQRDQDRILKGGGGMGGGGMGGGGGMSGKSDDESEDDDDLTIDDDILSDGKIDADEALQLAIIVGNAAYDTYQKFKPTFFTPKPSPAPTIQASAAPSISKAPSLQPSTSLQPSAPPSESQNPSNVPTGQPSKSAQPSREPSGTCGRQ